MSHTYLDDIQRLDDARGAHAGQTTVKERLGGFPGGVISERHDKFCVGGACGNDWGGVLRLSSVDLLAAV